MLRIMKARNFRAGGQRVVLADQYPNRIGAGVGGGGPMPKIVSRGAIGGGVAGGSLTKNESHAASAITTTVAVASVKIFPNRIADPRSSSCNLSKRNHTATPASPSISQCTKKLLNR
jgi:hypothetical protein